MTDDNIADSKPGIYLHPTKTPAVRDRRLVDIQKKTWEFFAEFELQKFKHKPYAMTHAVLDNSPSFGGGGDVITAALWEEPK